MLHPFLSLNVLLMCVSAANFGVVTDRETKWTSIIAACKTL